MRRPVAPVYPHRLVVLWICVILVAGLVPLEPYEAVHRPFCILCSDGALADGVLNIGLFLPLGAALCVAGWRPKRVLALGVLLSSGVEIAQSVIPGRTSSLSGIMFNTLGTTIGIALVWLASRWWPPRPPVADVLSIALTLGAGSVLAVTGGLLRPAFPDDTYYGGLAHRFGHLEWYGGRVLQASIDGMEISPGGLAASREIRRRLLSGATMHVRAQAGPRPPGLAPLLTIHDGHQREILLLGIDGEDVVYRYRTRAIAAGLRGPEIRARQALRGIAWRDPLAIIVDPAGTGYCIRVNATERCGLGFTVGTGWALIFDDSGFSLAHTALNSSWLALLFLPIGLSARLGAAFLTSVALSLVFLLIMPTTIGLIPTPMTEVAGALVGLLAGWAAGARVRLA